MLHTLFVMCNRISLNNHLLQQLQFFNNLKDFIEDFFVALLSFLVVASIDSDASLEGKSSNTGTLAASLPFLFYDVQM
jgi:hypothetical protein